MESRVKLFSPRNISGPLSDNSIAAFSSIREDGNKYKIQEVQETVKFMSPEALTYPMVVSLIYLLIHF